MNDTELKTGDFVEADDPFALFIQWLEEAERSETNDPTALALGTVDASGLPNVRMVLLKAVDEHGFVFYTNMESVKGGEISATHKAAMCFHWKSLRRQVRVRGETQPVSQSEADAYFASRARRSQIGALASKQSRTLEVRSVLEDAVADLERRFEGADVPRPDVWTGTRLVPSSIEFWQDGANRLHDRIIFERGEPSGEWSKRRLYP